MKITKEIDAVILELTRKGLKPKYIVMGYKQYSKWKTESDLTNNDEVDNYYLGCDIVVCGSDILEVVPDVKDIYSYYKRNS